MEEKESWGLTEEEIKQRLRQQNQENSKRGFTRGGRSSGQGVKLLYIRDYLHKYADKEHPKNATEICEYLATKNIRADRKTIYNDILRLQTDCGEPIEYSSSGRGYYISKQEFESYELRLLLDSVRASSYATKEEAEQLTCKIKNLSNVYDRSSLEIRPLVEGINRPKKSIARKVDTLSKAIAQKKKVSFTLAKRIPAHGYQTQKIIDKRNNSEVFIASPRAILLSKGRYMLHTYASKERLATSLVIDVMEDIRILSLDSEENTHLEQRSMEIWRAYLDKHYQKEHPIVIRITNNRVYGVLKEFGEDILMVPDGEKHFTITVQPRKINIPQLYGWVAGLNGDAKIISPQSVIDDMEAFLLRILDINKQGDSD